MPTGTHEQTINTALAEVLGGFGRTWTIRSEPVGKIFEEGGRPDILVEKSDGWPVVLEAEVGNHRQAEKEARSRIGNRLVSSSSSVHAAIAVVYPDELRRHSGEALRDAINTSELEYALLVSGADDSILRFPEDGWIRGGVADLAVLIHRSSIPAWRVEKLANALEHGVNRAAGTFTQAHSHGSDPGETIAGRLGQTDDEDGQTRRMAMAVVVDALIFHAALSDAGMQVPTDPARPVRWPGEIKKSSVSENFIPSRLVDEWESILAVNYWPIFHTASEIVEALPMQIASKILGVLWETAEELIAGGVTKSHDLTGIVFQRLIADRKFLATYYTGPPGAALLSGLALPAHAPPVAGKNWADADALKTMRVGDFACGTGTLLSTAYQRLSLLHEVHGGDPKALHPAMMEQGLVGLDVLTVAVHLTAAMLAGAHPDTPFAGESLLTMPYGSRPEWGGVSRLGSLDLLQETASFDIIQAAAETAGGRGVQELRDLAARVGHDRFDLVIMNPPFTRHGAREGDRKSVHNPPYAAFGADEEEQNRLAKHLKIVARGSPGHGHAGMASFFVDLAHRKIAPGGTLALVLPLTCMSGASWEGVRSLWRNEYLEPLIVTIANGENFDRSFSADTGMAEVLFVAKRRSENRRPTKRAKFVVLRAQPESTLEGEQIAEAVSTLIASGEIPRLEDGPFGGTRIEIGNTHFGDILDAPIPDEGAWQVVGIQDLTLAQTASQLADGRIWIEGMPKADAAEIPMARIGDICTAIGHHALDITGDAIKSDGLSQGPFEKLDGCSSGDAYPCLWNHDAKRERRMTVQPDSHCRIRWTSGEVPKDLQDRADNRWGMAARVHYSSEVRFNSQSLIVAMTPRPSLGGRAWPTIIFEDERREIAFSLWANSTLGVMSHWWMSNKSQAGRGTSSRTGFSKFTALDVRQLSDAQLEAAQRVFDDQCAERYLPFDQIDEDPARAELDRRLLVEILGLPAGLCAPSGPIERLRAKLASEPQIHSYKKTRVVFTDEGEMTEARTR